MAFDIVAPRTLAPLCTFANYPARAFCAPAFGDHLQGQLDAARIGAYLSVELPLLQVSFGAIMAHT